MNKSTDLILNALKYYDMNTEKYSKLLNKIKYYSLIIMPVDNELDYNTIIFYDKNKKEFYRSRYELLGYYNAKLKMWAWGWVINDKKNEIVFGKKLLNYALDLSNEFGFLKSELVTSRSRVSSEIQVDIHVSIASYITKNPMIFILILPIVSTEYTDDNTEIYKIQRDFNNTSEMHYLYLIDEYRNYTHSN